jgi:hypothetical protein
MMEAGKLFGCQQIGDEWSANKSGGFEQDQQSTMNPNHVIGQS